MSCLRNRYYGISKGSKEFPFREVIFDPNVITLEQAFTEYDALTVKRARLIRAMARWVADQEGPITDLPESFLAQRNQLTTIDARMSALVEQFPDVA